MSSVSDEDFDWDDEDNEDQDSEIEVSESSNEMMMSIDDSSEHSIDDIDPSSENSYPEDENHESENETLSDADSIVFSEPHDEAEEIRMDYGLEWTDEEDVEGASEIEVSSSELSEELGAMIPFPYESSLLVTSDSSSETVEHVVEAFFVPDSDSDDDHVVQYETVEPPTTFRVKIDENQNDTRSSVSGLGNNVSSFINCPICFNNIKSRSPCSFACGHLTCGLCVNQMLDRGINACPVCRKIFRTSDIRQLYPA